MVQKIYYIFSDEKEGWSNNKQHSSWLKNLKNTIIREEIILSINIKDMRNKDGQIMSKISMIWVI